MKREDYVFGSTRARIYEQALLTSDELLSLIDKADLSEAISQLKDSQYGKYFTEKDNDYEDALFKALLDLYDEVYDLLDGDELILNITSLKYLYHNLKVLTKSRIFNRDMEELLINVGLDSKELFDSGKNEENEEDDFPIRAIEEVLEDYSKYKDSERIDIIFDKYYFMNLRFLVDKLDIKLITDYVKEYIDLTNIEILFRLKRRNGNKETFELAVIEGGNIDKDVLIEKFNLEFDEISNSQSIKGSVFENIFRKIDKDGDTSILEEQRKEMEKKLFDDTLNISFGPEVIITYILKKEREMAILRTILTAKDNNISNEKLKERIGING